MDFAQQSPTKAEDEPQQQAEAHAKQDARRQWKVKRGVLAFMDNVAGQAAQTERELSAEIEKPADEHKKARE
jgi:hypothetical protein